MTRYTATASPGLPQGSVRFSAARLLAVGLIATGLTASSVRAEDKPDPVIAKIGNDVTIHLSDLTAAAASLPPQARQMPQEQLMPRLLDQMIDTFVMAIEARKAGLDKDPTVQKALHDIQERALASTYLDRQVAPLVTDAALKARFDKDIAGKPPAAEIHARHILVEDEATAKKIIAELKKGGDFAALSKQYSKDQAAVEQGGDLGWFKATDMVPEFSKAAFALSDNELSPAPVKTQFGWHVVQTLNHRTSSPPTFEQVKDELRQQAINEAVVATLTKARADVPVERFNPDGTPVKATDQAVPPAAPK